MGGSLFPLFLILSSGCHFIKKNKTICVILIEGNK